MLQAALILSSVAYLIHWAGESVINSMKQSANAGLNVALTRDEVTMNNMASYAPICSRSFDFGEDFPKLALSEESRQSINVRILNPYSTTAATGNEILAETGLVKPEGYRYTQVIMKPAQEGGSFIPFAPFNTQWETSAGKLTYNNGKFSLPTGDLAEGRQINIIDSATGEISDTVVLNSSILYRTGSSGNGIPDYALPPFAVPSNVASTFAIPIQLIIETQAIKKAMGVSANRKRNWLLTLQVQADPDGVVKVLGCFDPAANVAAKTCLRVGGKPTNTGCSFTDYYNNLAESICRSNGGFYGPDKPGDSSKPSACRRRT